MLDNRFLNPNLLKEFNCIKPELLETRIRLNFDILHSYFSYSEFTNKNQSLSGSTHKKAITFLIRAYRGGSNLIPDPQRKNQSHSGPTKKTPTLNQETKKPRDQEAKETRHRNQATTTHIHPKQNNKKPRHQETKKPRNQKTRKVGNLVSWFLSFQESGVSGFLDTNKTRNQETRKPGNQETRKPRN